MSLLDLQAFMQERLAIFDDSIDVGSGSEADKKIIQPLLRRLGPDPFAVDVRAFMMDRLNQEYPDFATSDGDAITDLLVKPSELFLDPIVRENQRIRNNLSFRDPSILTIDEAEALGANFFEDRETGDYSRGSVRIYYAAPQDATVNPSNYVTSRGGLSYFPDSIQSISVNEMLFNVEGSLYYFDINVTASQPGDSFNIEAGEMVSIAGLNAAVKVTNKARFQGGIAAEDAATYLGRVEQGITERSLVTQRGIVSRLTDSFPSMTRLNVVGFNDPEMQRDVITGGGLGPAVAYGASGSAINDGNNQPKTSRFYMTDAWDFTVLFGPAGTDISDYIITFYSASLSPVVLDVPLVSVIDANTLTLGKEALPIGLTGIIWTIRQNVLTLSGIPGGILFPNGPNGTIEIEPNKIHIGGCTDVHIRGTVLDTGSFVINLLTDDAPALQGLNASSSGSTITLGDYTMGPPGGDYLIYDPTYVILQNAEANGDSLQIISGPAAGIYRIQSVTQTLFANPVVTVIPNPPASFSGARWRLTDTINVDLVNPKETRVSGTDMTTIQAVTQVTTASGLTFSNYGVAIGDTLRLTTGQDKGDFTIIGFPTSQSLQLSRAPAFSSSNLSYTIFRPASANPLTLPMVRIDTIDLLDSNNQPVGSTIPYALAVGSYSTAFSHPAHGVKFEIDDALLGIISLQFPSGTANLSGKELDLTVEGGSPISVTFTGINPISLASAVAQINTAAGYVIAVLTNDQRIGILPSGPTLATVATSGGTNPSTSALPILFGGMYQITSQMIRAPEFDADNNYFLKVAPPIDFDYDIVQVIDGSNIGFYPIDSVNPYPLSTFSPPSGLTVPNAIFVSDPAQFAPQAARHIQFGSRSFGRVRMLFLEPTSVQLNAKTVFSTTLSNGTILNFLPDPEVSAQIVPALPGGVKPNDGSTVFNTTTLNSASTDFIAKAVQVGDIATIDYVPITGTAALADPVLTLSFKTLIVSVEGQPDKAIIFNRDNLALSPPDVSRQGVATEINSALGMNVASINGSNHLVINSTVLFIVRASGTANTILGFSTLNDTNNEAAHRGEYTITAVAQHALTVTPAFPNDSLTETSEQFTITRPGTQRVGTTQMSQNVGEAGFYFADFELVSQGTGDLYDIDADTALTATGYRSDGYYLTTPNSDLTFSTVDGINIHFSKTINEVGTDDSLDNSTTLIKQNVQVNYELSGLTGNIQNFLSSESERVVNESPLARHLIPHFIRFDLYYVGGPKESDVLPDMQTIIQALFPNQQLLVSNIMALVSDRGATDITNPLTLYGVIYNVDRSVTLERSQDRINVGRLAAFIPDRINLTRKLT